MEGVDMQLLSFLTLALVGGAFSSFTLRPRYPRGKSAWPSLYIRLALGRAYVSNFH